MHRSTSRQSCTGGAAAAAAAAAACITLLLCLSSAQISQVEAHSVPVRIEHVNPLKLRAYLGEYDKAIVFFYLHMCNICQKLRPIYARANYELQRRQVATDRKLALVAVECGADAEKCLRANVTQVPTFWLVSNGGRVQEKLSFTLVSPKVLLDTLYAD